MTAKKSHDHDESVEVAPETEPLVVGTIAEDGKLPADKSGSYVIAKEGPCRLTLAAPPKDEVLTIEITSHTAFRHRIVTPDLFNDGTADMALFSGQIGATLTLESNKGKWLTISHVGVEFL
jgi:hypothetical protein